jgi:RNA polymerase sigma factor (sigma-70 family)
MSGDFQRSASRNIGVDEPQTNDEFPQEGTFFEHLQQHDADSWDALLNLYAPQLRRDIARSLNKRNLPLEWAEDVEQDTWLTAVKQIGNFVWESDNKLYNWFRSIATYHIKNLERKLHNRFVSLEEIDSDADDSGLSLDFFMYMHGLINEGPETQFALRESLEILDKAMQMLKSREREILLKRLLYKESVQQMAQEYGVKPETISVILVRAKHSIQVHIATLKYQGN